MRAWVWCLLFLSVAGGGCKDDRPPGCRVADSTRLPPTPLTLNRDVTLERAGAGFVLVALDGDDVRWAPLGAEGVLGKESKLTLPKRAPEPGVVFATTAKSTPGDQLVVVYAATKPATAGQLSLMAVTQLSGGPASAPVALVDLPAGTDPASLRLAMGPSRSGRRAVLAWSLAGQADSPRVLLLRGDAQMQAPPAPVYRGPGQRGECLGVIPSRGDFAIGWLETGPPAVWRAFELNDDGGRAFDVSVSLDRSVVGCVSSTPTAHGYLLAYQNENGTFFANYNIDKGLVTSDIVAGVLQFGGVVRQPPIACVAPMGSEWSLLFERSTGPEVWRVNALGVPQGKAIVLPAVAGNVGPTSALPGTDAFFVTYLDQRLTDASYGDNLGTSRYFVRVDCPMAAPPYAPDPDLDAAVDGAIDAAVVDGK